uniref:Glutathione peroxidase n=1 Tax=Salmo salar TaxID=8030 RepID=B9EPR8_SALSA|nr:Probable phospholipid hydroperoxide glutathione peroxidase [Salmo salar]ACM09515.1 Probable phospholipid hydroperoxide glutathione peroxidase [Salmo salar]
MGDSTSNQTIYDFTVKSIDGEDVSMSKYQGFVMLIVNVASKCGLTKKNYADLNEIYSTRKDKPFKILAFPCNQFMSQESGTNEEIKCHIRDNIKAEFDVFEKIDVNGKNAHPLYVFLKKKLPGFLNDSIKWNFTKFLIDHNGVAVRRYSPNTDPSSFVNDIDELISKTAADPKE